MSQALSFDCGFAGLGSIALLGLTQISFAATPPTKMPASNAAAANSIEAKTPDPAALTAANGWVDLLANPKLEDWSRVSVSPGKPVPARNAWRYDAATGILSFEGTGVHEMLLHKTERGDGVLHVQWRFVGNPAKPNAGALVRTKADHSAWFEGQFAAGSLGSLSGAVPGPDGKSRRFTSGARRLNLMRKNAEEWNFTEITCVGKRLMLRDNGVLVADWDGCTVPVAHVGVHAEDSPIEFRAIKFKQLP